MQLVGNIGVQQWRAWFGSGDFKMEMLQRVFGVKRGLVRLIKAWWNLLHKTLQESFTYPD